MAVGVGEVAQTDVRRWRRRAGQLPGKYLCSRGRHVRGGQEEEMAPTDSPDTNKEKKGVEKKNEKGRAGNACHNSASSVH